MLIVDDNSEMRRAIRNHCAEVTDEFAEAADGSEAIKACLTFKPDWIVMDNKMEPMNGLAATREIRRRWQAVRVVVVTFFDDEEIRLAAREAGACAFLTKDRLTQLPGLISGKVEPEKFCQ